MPTRAAPRIWQKFIDEINGDWAVAYEDILASPTTSPGSLRECGQDGGRGAPTRLHDRLDSRHTSRSSAVSHAGVYDLRSEFGETESCVPALGVPRRALDNPSFTPASRQHYAKAFRTPLWSPARIGFPRPLRQGLQLFTALQLRRSVQVTGVSDEGHWIGKPQNTPVYHTVLDW